MQQFIEACKKIAALKLVQSSSGNLSARSPIYEDDFSITASGASFADIEQHQVVVCSIKTGGRKEANSLTASSELLLHQKIFQQQKRIHVILRYQPVYGTILACSSKQIKNFNIIPEMVSYLNKVCYLPYFEHPGSEQLVGSVCEAIKQSNKIVILKNCGLVAVGSSFDEVIRNATIFELVCEIIVKSPWKLNTIST